MRLSLACVALLALCAPMRAAHAQDAGRADAGRADAGAPPVVDAGPALRETTLAPQHRPRLGLTISPREGVKTGDVIHLVLTANAPEADQITVPQQSFAPFELYAKSMSASSPVGGRRTLTFRLDLIALEPGDATIPAITLRVVTASGEIGNVSTSARPIRIGSVLGNTPDAQPKPPTPPVVVMQDDYTLAWIGGAVLAILLTALITLLVARWWRKRKKVAPPPPLPRPPWDVAMEKLNALRVNQGRLLAEGRMMEFVDGVSDAVREYLGNRYQFEGLESTTDEVVAHLKRVPYMGVAKEQVGALLSDCDLVKFAKAVPDEEQCARLLDGAFHIVRTTIPAIQPMPQPMQGGPR